MQKQVSKQSLAIVALSILLAICMALTATYAAFSDSKKVTGTVNFTAATLAVTIEDTTEGASRYTAATPEQIAQDSALTFTFEITNDDIELVGTNQMQIKETTLAALNKLTYAVSNSNTSMPYKLTIAFSDASELLSCSNVQAATNVPNNASIQATNIVFTRNTVTAATIEDAVITLTISAAYDLATAANNG